MKNRAMQSKKTAAPSKPPKAKKEKAGRYYDYSLLFIILFIACFGLIMIYSAGYHAAITKNLSSFYYVKRQGMIFAATFVAMVLFSKIDYHLYAYFAIPAYLVSIAFMVLVNFTPFGIEYNGKKRWFGIGEKSLFQPTELVKLALILFLAWLMVKTVRSIDRWKNLVLIAILTAIPGMLVLINNLSSGIIIFGIAFVMYFVISRKRLRFFLAVAGGLLLAFLLIQVGDMLVEKGVLQPYQWERILVWQNPEQYAQQGGFQVLQGLYAIGSGGLFGRGLGNSIQKLGFVPEAQNDMIFSIICEELGLFGALCVILMFLFMLYRFLVIACNAPDLFGTMLVVGVMAHIAIQVILNIAVVTNTIPNTGITLPFISYGGTSVLFLMGEMCMVLSVSNQIRKKTD